MINKQNVQNFYRRVAQFGLLLPLSNIFIANFSKYFSPQIIKKILEWRYNKIEKKIVGIVGEINLPSIKECSYNNTTEVPIWWCWLQGEENIPLIPKLCLDSLRKHSNNHPIKIITLDNFYQFVSLNPKVINLYKNGRISNAHFSDILRINLLNQNGGLWIDSTVLLTSDLDENIFKVPFYTIKIKEFGYFVSKCRWSTFCLCGYKQNLLFYMVSEIFDKYIEKTDIFIDYFMFDTIINILYNKVPSIREMIDNNPYNNLNVHSLSHILNDNFDKDKYLNITKDTSMFKLNWKIYKSNELIKNNDNFFNYIKENG